MKIKFQQWDCILEMGGYSNNGRIALELIDERDGEFVATATVNIPEANLPWDELLIKDYSENEGMLDCLVNAGLVTRTGKSVQTGFVTCPIAKITDKLKEFCFG